MPDALGRDNPWEPELSSHDPTLALDLREFIVSILQQETHDKFIQIENKGRKLCEEITDHLREVKDELELLKI